MEKFLFCLALELGAKIIGWWHLINAICWSTVISYFLFPYITSREYFWRQNITLITDENKQKKNCLVKNFSVEIILWVLFNLTPEAHNIVRERMMREPVPPIPKTNTFGIDFFVLLV